MLTTLVFSLLTAVDYIILQPKSVKTSCQTVQVMQAAFVRHTKVGLPKTVKNIVDSVLQVSFLNSDNDWHMYNISVALFYGSLQAQCASMQWVTLIVRTWFELCLRLVHWYFFHRQ